MIRATQKHPLPRFDGDGFLLDPADWNMEIAQQIARADGIQALTPEHREILTALRDHFHRFGAAPSPFRHLCFVNRLDRHCVNELFHSEREAWRIAGLPNPGEEAKSYML